MYGWALLPCMGGRYYHVWVGSITLYGWAVLPCMGGQYYHVGVGSITLYGWAILPCMGWEVCPCPVWVHWASQLPTTQEQGPAIQHTDGGMMVHKLCVNTYLLKPYQTSIVTCKIDLIELIASTANNYEMLCHERLSN